MTHQTSHQAIQPGHLRNACLTANLLLAFLLGCRPDPNASAAYRLRETGATVTTKQVRDSTSTSVRLDGMAVSESMVADLQRLKSLKEIRLRNATLTSGAVLPLTKLPELEVLDLFACRFKPAALDGLGQLSSLRSLNLAQTETTNLEMRELASLTRLEVLAVGPLVTDDGLPPLSNCEQLQTLFLGDSLVKGPGLSSLTKLPRLKTLWLDRTEIGDEALPVVGKMRALQRLGLSETNVSDQGLRHLARLEELDYLSLNDTNVTNAGVELLADLPNLYILDLRGTKVTEEGVRRLKRQADPRLRVTR